MKRKKILESAAVIFSRKGYHQARMDEIATQAEVAKGTLYYNFSSKAKLFAATVTEGLETITRGISEKLESDLPFAEHFHLLIESAVNLYLEHHDFARIFFNELTSGIDDEVLEEIENVREQLLRFFSDLLETGQKKGYLKEMDPRMAAVSLAGIIDSLCMRHLRYPEESDSETIVDTAYTILSSGLLKIT